MSTTTRSEVLDKIVELAREILGAEKVILYGSRARGDDRSGSDFDIAFEGADPAKWLRFHGEVDETVPTLLRVDCVRMEDAPDDLRENILREGKVLYPR